jgi:hypothetical protein
VKDLRPADAVIRIRFVAESEGLLAFYHTAEYLPYIRAALPVLGGKYRSFNYARAR